MFILRKGLPNKPNVIESNKANDFPCPLLPDTRVMLLLSRSISVNALPNDPKFLNLTFLNVIILQLSVEFATIRVEDREVFGNHNDRYLFSTLRI